MLPIILCLFEGLNDLRLVYNDCEKIYFITFVKVGVAIYNDHTVYSGKTKHKSLCLNETIEELRFKTTRTTTCMLQVQLFTLGTVWSL